MTSKIDPKPAHPSTRRPRNPHAAARAAVKLAMSRRFPSGSKLAQQEQAYRAGQQLAVSLLQYIEQAQHDDAPWDPEHGPDPSWTFSRGVLDILMPALDDTLRLMGTKAGKQFARALRQCLLDDLRYHTASALEIARTQPPHFEPHSEEW